MPNCLTKKQLTRPPLLVQVNKPRDFALHPFLILLILVMMSLIQACDSEGTDEMMSAGTSSIRDMGPTGGTEDPPLTGGMSAGEMSAGEMTAGEMTAGEMTAGEMTAGEMTAGEMTAGEMTAGEMTAGEMTAGEMTAGEMTAGEMTAGEMTAGEMTAGEMTAGETPPDPGDLLLFEGTVLQQGTANHRFSVESEIGVQIKTRGRDGAACIDGTDTVLELFSIGSNGRNSIAFNDDYAGGDFCSQILTTVTAGEYEVEVRGFGNTAVEEYILEITFHPILQVGEVCDEDSPSAGICVQRSACINNGCALTQPNLTAANATKTATELFVSVVGSDPDIDALYLNLRLYDAMGGELAVDEFGETVYYATIPSDAAPLYTGLTNFDFNFKAELLNLDLGVELGVEVEDIEGNRSEELIIPIANHPTLPELSGCDLEGFLGYCEESLLCQADAFDMLICQSGLAPSVDAVRLSSRRDELVIAVDGQDPNDDVINIGVTLYDEQGTALLGGTAEGRYSAEITGVRLVDEMTGSKRYYAVLSGDYVALTSAAELTLIDSLGLESQAMIAVRAALPPIAEGQDCDLEALDDLCAEGVCYPDLDPNTAVVAGRGLCQIGLPGRGQACSLEIGCEEGFICYGPDNSGGLSSLYQTCMRACDDNAEVNGCELDELCLPDFDFASFGITDEPSPGVCLISDQCVPGDEANTCPNADSTCARAESITLCVELTDRPAEERGQLGDLCSGINTPCDSGLICELGICQNACNDSLPCAAGETCRVFDEVYYEDTNAQYAACLSLCDPILQDCGEGEACMIFQSGSSVDRLTVCEEAVVGTLTDGEACDRDGTDFYWGDCQADQFCAATFRDHPDQCLPICTTEDSSACTGDRVCALNTIDSSGVGLCTGECNFFTGGGCAMTEDCLLGYQGADSNGDTQIVGGCFDNPNPGSVPTDAPCVLNEATNTSDCAPGHICFDLDGDLNNECVALCQANSVDYSCANPTAQCVNQLADGSFVFGENLTELGVCL